MPPRASGSVSLRLPVSRDLRDRAGRTSALAQVLATGERILLVGCCLPHMLPEARERIPLADLCNGGLACVCRACVAGRGCAAVGLKCEDGAEQAGVVVTEWDVLVRAPALTAARAHLVAVDPPYRNEHVTLINRLAEAGMCVHLHYGHDERQTTARLLRYLVHPRFAMVCTYRALEEMRAKGGPGQKAEVLARAAELAWYEAQVVLGPSELSRALGVLEQLNLDQSPAGEAKLEAHNVAAYAEAEADYEECSRLCLNL